MTDHLPECPQFCDGQPPKCRGGDCTLCDEVDCYCDRLRACEQRVRREALGELVQDYKTWDRGYAVALNAAEAAVEAIPAPYKVEGDHSTYDSYHEGKADMQDLAVSAIHALKEKP